MKQIENIRSLSKFSEVTFHAYVERVEVLTTRTKREIAFVSVYDTTGRVELVVFPKTYEQHKDLLVPENLICIEGILDKYRKKIRVAVINLSKSELAPELPRG